VRLGTGLRSAKKAKTLRPDVVNARSDARNYARNDDVDVLAERRFREMIDALPAAVYTTDAEGHITHFNRAAVELSGRTPELGNDQWCVSWKLFWSDGTPMAHDQCPMAVALREGRIMDGVEAILERPDGTRVWFTPYPRPFYDGEGKIVGGLNMLIDITERKKTESSANLLAAIVDSSDDAIVSKNLDGMITSWNTGAERLFGYRAEEAIGKHISIIIPAERQDEERKIIEQLKRGERVDHFETIRTRKDGAMLDISLTISPLRDNAGRIVGASKVARDVTERKRIERALRDSEENLRTLADGLEAQVCVRTRELEHRNAEVLQQSEQLRELTNRLLRSQDYERRHMARELHDSAGQLVVALGMNLANIAESIKRNPALKDELSAVEDGQNLVQMLSREIRTTSYLLHPPLLDEAGLAGAIRWYMEGVTKRSGLEIELTMPDDFGRLPTEMELALFRIVQECLTNIHRHSGSKAATILFSRQTDRVCLEIVDKGQGMPIGRLAEVRAQRAGVGVTGMRERVRHLGGVMDIQSCKAGTKVSVVLPVSANAVSESETIDVA